MPVNVPLLRKTLEHIEAHPGEWDQENYRCGSAACFAGHAALLAGGEWDRPNEPLDDYLAPSSDRPFETADERAVSVLGLEQWQADRLFDGGNSLDDLRRIVAELSEDAS